MKSQVFMKFCRGRLQVQHVIKHEKAKAWMINRLLHGSVPQVYFVLDLNVTQIFHEYWKIIQSFLFWRFLNNPILWWPTSFSQYIWHLMLWKCRKSRHQTILLISKHRTSSFSLFVILTSLVIKTLHKCSQKILERIYETFSLWKVLPLSLVTCIRKCNLAFEYI